MQKMISYKYYFRSFVGNLKQLGVLSLRDNKLQYLPVEVGHCTALHVLDVSGNRYVIFLFAIIHISSIYSFSLCDYV